MIDLIVMRPESPGWTRSNSWKMNLLKIKAKTEEEKKKESEISYFRGMVKLKT